eukprot:TRINITY_DN6649_c0_g1_i2.p1 TRINITY_DN6649_c0_g1~~TRINITY_DN6649_c0_g1_i2.p1  ORF type:complete len:436 (-),score=96.87 TRINITY_DN6649_c0_g1_i2:88-1395(-)
MSVIEGFIDRVCCLSRGKTITKTAPPRSNFNEEHLFNPPIISRPANGRLPHTEIQKLRRKTCHLHERRTWTSEEDAILMEAVQKYKGKNWRQVALYLPGRTPAQCTQRWRRLQPRRLRKPWTKEEDAKLVALVEEFGNNWSAIAQRLEERSGKQVRERFLNTLDPNISHRAWDESEDLTILQLFYKIGPKWAEIAKHLNGRPENMVKNRFYSHIRKDLATRERLNLALTWQVAFTPVTPPTPPEPIRIPPKPVEPSPQIKFEIGAFLDQTGRLWHAAQPQPQIQPHLTHTEEVLKAESKPSSLQCVSLPTATSIGEGEEMIQSNNSAKSGESISKYLNLAGGSFDLQFRRNDSKDSFQARLEQVHDHFNEPELEMIAELSLQSLQRELSYDLAGLRLDESRFPIIEEEKAEYLCIKEANLRPLLESLRGGRSLKA